ncbi:hypothetical protein, partial [Burkholderia cepacia]|uniref:hypothetical protein n=1 Tax=Burkholderia cepacia TaxID=292 RepID=UPI000650254D
MRAFNQLRHLSGAAAIATTMLIPSAAFAYVFPQPQLRSAGAEVATPANVTMAG